MSLTLDEVKHIAELARLSLSQVELETFCRQLSDILEYATRLQALDTSAVQAVSGAEIADSRLRADEVRPSLSLEELLSNAPQVEDEQFRVPPVLE